MVVAVVVFWGEESFFGIGGGGRLGGRSGGLEREGVRSAWIHWWINGMIEEVEEENLLVSPWSLLLVDFKRISRLDFERFRLESKCLTGDKSGGDVEQVRWSFWSALVERRKLAWKEDDRVNLLFKGFCRSGIQRSYWSSKGKSLHAPNEWNAGGVSVLSRSTNDFDVREGASEMMWLMGNEIVEFDWEVHGDRFDWMKLKWCWFGSTFARFSAPRSTIVFMRW